MKVIVVIFAYNEGKKLIKTITSFPSKRDYDIMVVDDGSDDNTPEILPQYPDVLSIRNNVNSGVGFGMRKAFDYAIKNKYDVVIPFAGNYKDRPEDISVLMSKINEGYDFVQGSRYCDGGTYKNMPFYRQIATQFIHPWIFSYVSGRKITDSTNGFRAIRTTLLASHKINLNQNWLNQYELEPYLYLRAIECGFKVTEVPVTKIYPEKGLGKYTKMKPIWGWWSILRPVLFLGYLKILQRIRSDESHSISRLGEDSQPNTQRDRESNR